MAHSGRSNNGEPFEVRGGGLSAELFIPNGGFAVRNLLSLAALRVAAESRFLAALGMTTGLRWE
jgi:hypothetical protein